MRIAGPISVLVAFHLAVSTAASVAQDRSAVELPRGVKAVWDISKAHRETTPTRERLCINGLWQWQPTHELGQRPPEGAWGYFKVPGPWPGIVNFMQKDSQTLYVHPSWKDEKLNEVAAAWYRREIEIPKNWAGRRIVLTADYINSNATVYLDGRPAGTMLFPSGVVDLTALCEPGGKHMLAIELVALPLKEVVGVFNDSAAPKIGKGRVERRGLCGDVYLVGEPKGPRIANVKIDTSVRQKQIAFETLFEGLDPDGRYALRATLSDHGKKIAEFTGKTFAGSDLKQNRMTLVEDWMPDKLWDIHTPENQFEASVALLDADGKPLDEALPARFGFREFWIEGRDFYLNGSRIYLSALPSPHAQVGAALANYAAAKEALLRFKSFGINFVYGHNYGCEPGTHLSFEEVLRAADDVGMLFAMSQPHCGQYDWDSADAERTNGYAHHAAFYVRAAGNHPSVVFYAMNHNLTGYGDDMNPDALDGIQDPRSAGQKKRAEQARRAEAVVQRIDPTRIVYHHHSGNLGSMITINFYPNWVPVQEMSDWFGYWAEKGVKPIFTCEYSAPFTWDWAMYRGYYKGKREYGSAKVPWEFCNAEWNAQFAGDKAFDLLEAEKVNLRWETKKYRDGALWNRWNYPHQLGDKIFTDQEPIFFRYITDNWRAFRGLGLSANSPWEHGRYWILRKGADTSRQELPVDWDNLQRPGLSPDYVYVANPNDFRMDLYFKRSDWIPTEAAKALYRNNMPLLAYIGGKAAAFTSKDHNFLPGETVEKQLIVINNSRLPVSCECRWTLGRSPERYGTKPVAMQPFASGEKSFGIETGQQERIPLRFDLPPDLQPGKYELNASAKFSTGETQTDTFVVHVLPPPPEVKTAAKIALYDPKGETAKLLDAMQVKYHSIEAGADLAGFDILIVGKAAMTLDGPGPNVLKVRDGLKAIVFEQTADVLEKRFGFRIEEYGLRNVFQRMPDHPILAGLELDHLADWRGESTILPPKITYTNSREYGPWTVKWCDIPITRLWRCSQRGNVACALIEKPACGNFLPILDGGYSLQYSPLMEYREGRGMVLFCQTDVTGRTERDPAADRLARNILAYVSDWKPAAALRKPLYVGEAAGKSHLEKSGVSIASYDGGNLAPDQVLVVGPGAGAVLAKNASAVRQWLKAGGRMLAVGADQDDVKTVLPKVAMKKAEHIAACFEPLGIASPMAGVSSADVHNRDPRIIPLVTGGAEVLGDGVLAKADGAEAVFCQMAPWQFDYAKQYNVKRTFRRFSFTLTRLLGNMDVEIATPLLTRFDQPVDAKKAEKRWLDGLYLDVPEEWDNPYRFFRW